MRLSAECCASWQLLSVRVCILLGFERSISETGVLITGLMPTDLVANHLHPFRITILPRCNDFFQQSNVTTYHAWLTVNLVHGTFGSLPDSPLATYLLDLNSIEYV